MVVEAALLAGIAAAVGAVVGAAVDLTGVTSAPGGIPSAALGRTPWGPNEMTQSPKMKSPVKTNTAAKDFLRIVASKFASIACAGSNGCAPDAVLTALSD